MTEKPIIPHLVKIRDREYWRVNIPTKLRECYGEKKTRHFKHKGMSDDFAADIANWREPLSGVLVMERQLEKIARHPLIVEAAARNELKRIEAHSATIKAAVNLALESKRAAGIRANSMASLTCSLKSFSEFCQKTLSSVTAADIDGWLAVGDYAPKTRKNHLVDLKTFFNWCKKRRMIDADPTAGVEMPRVPFKSAEIMPVADIEKMLHTCQQTDPALLGYLALILFGGLRSKESARALPENVHDGIVDIGGNQTKLNVRRCFPIQPVLAAWLAVPGVEIGGVNIYNRFVSLRKQAGVHVPDNGLRHTSASCWLELLGAAPAAKMLGHSEVTLYRHYASKITAADAKLFVELRPTPQP